MGSIQSVRILKPASTDELNPATEEKQDNIISALGKLVSFEIPAYDYIVLTYVVAGNGAGEINTVVYKTGGASGTTVTTLTLAYDASNRLLTITKT